MSEAEEIVQDVLAEEGVTSDRGLLDQVVSAVTDENSSLGDMVGEMIQNETVQEIAEGVAEAVKSDHPEVAQMVSEAVQEAKAEKQPKGEGTDKDLMDHMPSKEQMKKVMNYFRKLEPVYEQAMVLLEKAEPHVEQAAVSISDYLKKIDAYHPRELFGMFFGVIMMLFGSSFLIVITILESFIFSSWTDTRDSFYELYNHFMIAYRAWKKDNLVDADNDGVADVTTLSDKELAKRKVLLLIRCTDPQKVTDAATTIAVAFMASVAAVRVEFARIITLGHSLSEVVYDMASQFTVPQLEAVLEPAYRKWAAPIIRYTISGVVIFIVFWFARILCVVHCAFRGAQLLSKGLLSYVIRTGAVKEVAGIPITSSNSGLPFDVLCGTCAVLGIAVQWFFDFGLPFPMNYLLFPLLLVEYLASWLIYLV